MRQLHPHQEKLVYRKSSLLLFLLILLVVAAYADSPTGVQIQTELPDVQVWVDGNFVGVTREFRAGNSQLRAEGLDPGTHTIECRLEQYQPFVTTVLVTESEILTVVVTFVAPTTEAIGIESAAGELKAQTGSIRVLSDPTGAVVELDGRRQSVLTDVLLTPVTVGVHRVVTYFAGDSDEEKLSIEVTVPPDGEIEVVANFWDRTIRTNAEYSIHIRSDVDATVFIDGAEVGTTGASGARFALMNGRHAIELRSRGHETYSTDVDLTGNDILSVRMTPIVHRVSITSVPAGVPVERMLPNGDREHIGVSPVTATVPIGSNTFYLDQNGYKQSSVTVDIAHDTGTVRRLVTLERATCTIDVLGGNEESALLAPVLVNGERVGTVPLTDLVVPAESVALSVGGITRHVYFEPGGNYNIGAKLPLEYIPFPVSSEGLPGHEETPPEPRLFNTHKTVDVVTGVDLSVQGGVIAAAIGAVAAPAAMILGGLEPSAEVIIPGVVLGGGAGVLVAILLAGNRVEPREVPDEAAIARNRRLMADHQSAVQAVETHNEQVLEKEVARVREENRIVADSNVGSGTLDIRDHTTGGLISPYPLPLSDEDVAALMQGTWLRATPEGFTPNRKYEFDGDAYSFWQLEGGRFVLEESGTFEIKDGVYIEIADRIRHDGVLREVRDGDVSRFEHGSFYVDSTVLSIGLKSGDSDGLLGEWPDVGSERYSVKRGQEYEPSSGYDNQRRLFRTDEYLSEGTRVTFGRDGSVIDSDYYSYPYSVVEYYGADCIFMYDDRRSGLSSRIIGRDDSEHYLVSPYYVREE